MLGNMKNLMSLLGNAKEMREKFEKVQAELAQKTVEGDAGAGAVRVTVNGKMEVLRVQFDRSMLATLVGTGDDADAAMVEDLVAAAANDAMAKARALIQDEIQKATGGLNLPGLDKMMGV